MDAVENSAAEGSLESSWSDSDAAHDELRLPALEQESFAESLLLFGIAIDDPRRAVSIIQAHYCCDVPHRPLTTEVSGERDELITTFQRHALSSLRVIWNTFPPDSLFTEEERLDAIGVSFPYERLFADAHPTDDGLLTTQVRNTSPECLPSSSNDATSSAAKENGVVTYGRVSVRLADSFESAGEVNISWSDRPRRRFRHNIKLPFRPRRTTANLDGPNARVASARDLKKYFNSAAAGTRLFGVMPIVEVKLEPHDATQTFIVKRPSVLTLDEETRARHVVVVGPTGCGKTSKVVSSVLRSDIAEIGKSLVVLDSKGGELLPLIYELNEKYRLGRPVWVVDFRHPARSNGWNPLAALDTFSKVRAFAHRLCYAVQTRPNPTESEFWILASIKCLSGILWALKTDPKELRTLARAQQIVELSIYEIRKWASQYPRISGLQSFLEFLDSGAHNAHTVLTDLQNRLAMWSDDDICRVTSTAEVDLGRIVSEPSILVVRVNESDASCLRPLTNALFTELVSELFKRAEESPGGRLPVPVSLVIEEFASAVGRIPEFGRFINVVRSRGLSVLASVQSLSQVEFEYGAECESVLAGFCSRIFFPGVGCKDADYASALFGNMTVDHREKSVFRDEFASYSSDVGHSEAVKIVKRPIFTSHEIRSPIRHPRLGGAVTFDLPEVPPFQAFLTPAYELETLSQILAATADRDKLGALRLEGSEPLEPGRTSAPEVMPSLTQTQTTDTRGWTDEKLRERLESVKTKSLDWPNTTGTARKWWDAFERENQITLSRVVELAEKLQIRGATITDFFLAYVYSNTDNIDANLAYLDYTRFKREAENRKKTEQAPPAEVLEHPAEDLDPSDPFADLFEEPAKQVRSRRRKRKRRNPTLESGSAPVSSSESAFVHCGSCRSLVPTESDHCQMCGAKIDPPAAK